MGFLPKDIFQVLYPFMIVGTYQYTKMCQNKNISPEMVYMCVFYIAFFSLIGHKENRFLLPILPFLFLMTGYSLARVSQKWSRSLSWLLWIFTGWNCLNFTARQCFHHRFWDALDYITNYGDSPPHSLYSMHRFETPYYSWLHQRG